MILARTFFLAFCAMALCESSIAAKNVNENNRVDISKAMLTVARTLDKEPSEPLSDPYAGKPDAFKPRLSRAVKVRGLNHFEMRSLHLVTYDLPPSVMVPKVWLSLKSQEFFKSPNEVPVIMVTPTNFDQTGATKYPLAILSHGSGGNIHLQLWYAQILAKMGYVVGVIDHFCAKGRVCNPMDIKTFHVESNAVDIVRTADYLQKQPYIDAKNTFLLGWSLGGMAVEMSARASFINAIAPHLKYNAAVCFYPQIVVHEMMPMHKSKLLFIIAELDDYTPAKNIKKYVTRMKKLPGQRHHHVRVITAKNAHHSFDRIDFTPFWSWMCQALYTWSTYEGFGRTVVNGLGNFVADKFFGDYAYYKLQTFKNGQVLIDTQNPLRGFAPLNDVRVSDMEEEISHDFKPWSEFFPYFKTHVSHGASLEPNTKAQKWALKELLKYLSSHKIS